MIKWIDADEAIARIAGQMSYEIEVETGNETDCIELAEELLNDITSIDIVRCKECKWFDTDNTGETYCMSAKGLCDVNADDFCSYGEAKEK